MRIFLSYGHDEYASLASRIKLDLEAQNHQVWFDLERLKAGCDWERYIEDGVDWVSAVPNAGRFLMLMTPHAVRRPTGYCLNELARAHGRNLSIIPVMVSFVEPPLSICRLQWLDMRNCFPVETHEAQYARQFEQLARALEEKHVAFEGVQQRLLNYLQPITYDDDLTRHLSRFTGREWVMTEVNQWLASSSRVLWITGEAGVGKSALAAWLCAMRPEIAAYHFCRFGNSERVDFRKALFSIAYQLSTQLPVYQERLNSSSLDKTIIEANPAATFDRLFVTMLTDIIPTTDGPQVLLIDALDEATEGGKNELAALIATEFCRLPSWLRLVVTSRPHEPAINFALQALDPWKLEAGRPENLEDIRRYLRRELQPLTGEAEPSGAVVEALLEKSEGLFLYVNWVCKELLEGRLSLKQVAEFPRGLGGVYADFFRRYFADLDEYASACRPALEVVCAAREPLERDDLAAMFGWSEYESRSLGARLGSLFPIADGRVRPFHQSVNDWLTDAQRAGPYYVDVQAGERRLADFAWQQYQRGVGTMSRYCIVHVLAHLAACRKEAELRELLLDWDWIQAKLATTDPSRLALDYEYLRNEPGITAIQSAIRLASHALAFRPSELKTQLVGRLRTEEFGVVKVLLSKILSSGRNGPWLLPVSDRLSTPSGPLIRTLFGHQGAIRAVDITQDGRRAISATHGELKVWDLERGAELTCISFEEVAKGLALAYDGRFATFVTESGRFEKWDLTSREKVGTFGRKHNSFSAAGISKNQVVFAIGTVDGSLYLWDEQNKFSHRPRAHYGEISALALTDNGSILISNGADGWVRIWNPNDLSREIASWLAPLRRCLSLALAHDGSRALCLREDDKILLWDVHTGKELVDSISSPKDTSVTHLWLDHERSSVLFARQNGSIAVWDVAKNRQITSLERHGELSCLVMSRDATKVISGSTDGTLKWWDLDRVAGTVSLKEHPQGITTLAAAPDDSFIAGSADGTISFWSSRDGAYLRSFTRPHGPIHGMWLTCHGYRLVTRSRDGSVLVWNTKTGELLRRLDGPPWAHIESITPDGQFAGCICPSDLSKIKNVYFPMRWNCSVPKIRRRTPAVSVRNFTFLQAWNVETETELIAVATDRLISVARVSGDGSRIVAGSHDGSVIFCDVPNSAGIRTVRGHAGRVTSVDVSHSGDVAITVSEDGIAYVWSPETGGQVASFTGDGPLTSCALSADGKLIAAAESSGSVHILKLCP